MIGLLYVSAIRCILVRTLPNSYKNEQSASIFKSFLSTIILLCLVFNIESPVQRNDLLGKYISCLVSRYSFLGAKL